VSDFGSSGDVFEPSASPESSAANPEFESVNVCRVAALATLFQGGPSMIRPLMPDLQELGFRNSLAADGREWQTYQPIRLNQPPMPNLDNLDNSRFLSWQRLNDDAQPEDATRFIVAVLGSAQERESAAAAAALWRCFGTLFPTTSSGRRYQPTWRSLFIGDPFNYLRWPDDPLTEDAASSGYVAWRPGYWQVQFSRMQILGDRDEWEYLIVVLVRQRLAMALRSPDPIVRSLAAAALELPTEVGTPNEPVPPNTSSTGGLVSSTMIHGTWAWKGDWWRPRGDFHRFILQNHRKNLFNRGARFSWSGALSDKQRRIAAEDFCDWADDVAPHGLQTLFGHSYGGEVAARAAIAGARIHELVLLSTPATKHVVEAAKIAPRVIDIRLRFDPVLGIAGVRQRLRLPAPSNVTEVIFDRWRLGHGATHDPSVWLNEDVARRAGL
jgi:pimeloyl-ACP methyl ester carboxylesterase